MARNLDSWDALAENAARTIVVTGESNGAGTGLGSGAMTQAWPWVLRDAARGRWPSRGLGFRGLALGEWASAGTPTRHTTSDVYDKGPFRCGRRLDAAADIYTYTVPTGHTAHSSSRLVYVDASGSGDWSISINGGAYTSAGAATLGDNAVKSVTIGTTVSAGGTIAVRGANAAGTNVQCDLLGIDLRNGVTEGLLLHNIAIPGHKLSGPVQSGVIEAFYHTTSGDRLAILDYLDPDVLIPWFISDAILNDVPTYETALQAVISRVQGNGGQCMLQNYPDLIYDGGFTAQNQQDIRDATLDLAADNDCATFDVLDKFGMHAAAVSAGYFQDDEVHFSVTGHELVATVARRLLFKTRTAFVTG